MCSLLPHLNLRALVLLWSVSAEVAVVVVAGELICRVRVPNKQMPFKLLSPRVLLRVSAIYLFLPPFRWVRLVDYYAAGGDGGDCS